jgi:hypothetical protein
LSRIDPQSKSLISNGARISEKKTGFCGPAKHQMETFTEPQLNGRTNVGSDDGIKDVLLFINGNISESYGQLFAPKAASRNAGALFLQRLKGATVKRCPSASAMKA